jgi:hypothetical protein
MDEIKLLENNVNGIRVRVESVKKEKNTWHVYLNLSNIKIFSIT